MINVQTSDGVRVSEARDGALWTLRASVTRCYLSQPAIEAALMFVPHVTLEQLENIVRGIARYSGRVGHSDAADVTGIALAFMTHAQAQALRDVRGRPRHVWDFGSTTVNKLRAYGFAASAGDLAITDAGRFALDPKPMHYMHGQDYPPCGAAGSGCPFIHKVTCLKCQLAAAGS